MLNQQHLIDAFLEAAAREQWHHAYLFAAPTGSGKREMALWLAQLANCESEGERPCGACHACHLIAAGNHPDVSWVSPSEKSKKDQIRIEEARAVRTEVSRRPVLGRRKVVVIDPADEMTLDAVNCLLKTLEEPPGYATLILLVQDTANVIPTVLSRCQVARFKPVPRNEIERWLREQGAGPDAARDLARLADGRPGEALRLLNEEGALRKRERALSWLQAVAGADSTDALRLSAELRAGSDDEDTDVPDSLRWAESWLRDVCVLQSGGDPDLLVNADRIDALRYAADAYEPGQTLAAAEAIVKARRYLAGNGNASLVTDCLLMDLIPRRQTR